MLVSRTTNQHSNGNGTRTSGVLNSWKEIAAYMERGIRTVQRWELNRQLPVHRLNGKNRSPVLAFREELDDWLRRTPSQVKAKDTCNTLLEVACSLQSVAYKLVALSEGQTRIEGKKLLAELNAVVGELAQLNDSSRNGHSPPPLVEDH